MDIDFISGSGRIRYADGTDEMLPALNSQKPEAGFEQNEDLYPAFAPAANLVDVITGKADNGSPGEIGWRSVELLDAAYRSAALNGQTVQVKSLYE
jgi:hypothetical protein